MMKIVSMETYSEHEAFDCPCFKTSNTRWLVLWHGTYNNTTLYRDNRLVPRIYHVTCWYQRMEPYRYMDDIVSVPLHRRWRHIRSTCPILPMYRFLATKHSNILKPPFNKKRRFKISPNAKCRRSKPSYHSSLIVTVPYTTKTSLF